MSTAAEDRYLAMAITEAEAPHLGKDASELRQLAEDLIGLGYSEASVSGLIGWLVLKAAGRRDRSSSKTRAKYRKMLADLERPRKRPNIAGAAGTMLILVLAVPTMAGLSLVSRRRRILCAQRLDITWMVGVDVLVVVVLVEIPAVVRELEPAGGAEIHTLSAHRRPPMHTLCAAPKAA